MVLLNLCCFKTRKVMAQKRASISPKARYQLYLRNTVPVSFIYLWIDVNSVSFIFKSLLPLTDTLLKLALGK
jgi:hypothetical protein